MSENIGFLHQETRSTLERVWFKVVQVTRKEMEADLIEKLKIHTCKRCGKVFQNIDKSGCIHNLEFVDSVIKHIGGERTRYSITYHCLTCGKQFDHVYTKLSRHWGGGIECESPNTGDFKNEICPETQHTC